jgi:hypothetical protein
VDLDKHLLSTFLSCETLGDAKKPESAGDAATPPEPAEPLLLPDPLLDVATAIAGRTHSAALARCNK